MARHRDSSRQTDKRPFSWLQVLISIHIDVRTLALIAALCWTGTPSDLCGSRATLAAREINDSRIVGRSSTNCGVGGTLKPGKARALQFRARPQDHARSSWRADCHRSHSS